MRWNLCKYLLVKMLLMSYELMWTNLIVTIWPGDVYMLQLAVIFGPSNSLLLVQHQAVFIYLFYLSLSRKCIENDFYQMLAMFADVAQWSNLSVLWMPPVVLRRVMVSWVISYFSYTWKNYKLWFIYSKVTVEMGQVTKLWLSCYLVLLSIDSKTR